MPVPVCERAPRGVRDPGERRQERTEEGCDRRQQGHDPGRARAQHRGPSGHADEEQAAGDGEDGAGRDRQTRARDRGHEHRHDARDDARPECGVHRPADAHPGLVGLRRGAPVGGGRARGAEPADPGQQRDDDHGRGEEEDPDPARRRAVEDGVRREPGARARDAERGRDQPGGDQQCPGHRAQERGAGLGAEHRAAGRPGEGDEPGRRDDRGGEQGRVRGHQGGGERRGQRRGPARQHVRTRGGHRVEEQRQVDEQPAGTERARGPPGRPATRRPACGAPAGWRVRGRSRPPGRSAARAPPPRAPARRSGPGRGRRRPRAGPPRRRRARRRPTTRGPGTPGPGRPDPAASGRPGRARGAATRRRPEKPSCPRRLKRCSRAVAHAPVRGNQHLSPS